jgi:phage terminase large subunit-like protein
MNYIEEYYKEIVENKIIVCNKVRRTYKHLMDNINNPQGAFLFDETKANRAIKFIETFCKLTKGVNKPFVLETWQKAFVSAIFGFVNNTGKRQYREAILIVGRKNGKTTLAAAIALYMLIADAEPSAEIYSVATTKDQSKIVWKEAKNMIHKSRELKAYCKCHVADIQCYIENGEFKHLASDSNSLDGLNTSFCIMDEMAAWKDPALYDIMNDSMSARQQPLTLITTTAGFIRKGIYDTKYKQAEDIINGYDGIGDYVDETFLPLIYEIDDKNEWRDTSCWQKSNPGLGTIRSLQELTRDVNTAKAGHKDVKDILTKFFNVPETSSEAYLDWQDIKNEEHFDPLELKPRYGIGGFDLSRTTDLTSAAILFRVPNDPKIYVLTKSWMPEDVLERREQEDKVPYRIWIEKDYLRLCSGKMIDYHMISDWFAEIREKYDIYMYKIGYDNYGATYLTQEMTETYGESTMVEVRQGAKTLSIPLQNLKAELKSKNVIYNNDPILAWSLANLKVKRDSNANIQPDKDRHDKVRDDAAMALLDAFTVYLNSMEDYLNII